MSDLTLKTETVHGRQAFVLENGQFRVCALTGGGHLVDLRLLSADPRLAFSPFYVPSYPTIDPQTYDPAHHAALYGEGANARLLAGYMGHLYWVERALTLRRNETVVHVEEWIENLTDFDRPFNRDQHPTFGPPFVAPGKTMLDLPGTKGVITPGRDAGGALPSDGEFAWPYVTKADGSQVALRPFQSTPASTTYYPVLLDQTRAQSYFTLYNTDYPLLVGYLFPTADNPWIVDWQEHQSDAGAGPDGKFIARGIEFGTSPFDEGLRASVDRGSLFDTPTYQWIGGRQRLKTVYTIFFTEIPLGFQGVQDVQRTAGQIVITEEQTGRQLTVATGGREG